MKTFLKLIAKIAAFAFVANEVRGLILAAPIMYAMYRSGGTFMAIWLGFCSLAGIALTVAVPIVAKRLIQRRR